MTQKETMMIRNRHFGLKVAIAGLIFLALCRHLFAADVVVPLPRQYPVPVAPPMVIAPPPPVVIVPQEPRCRVVRETTHDDILNTNDWVEREVCD